MTLVCPSVSRDGAGGHLQSEYSTLPSVCDCDGAFGEEALSQSADLSREALPDYEQRCVIGCDKR